MASFAKLDTRGKVQAIKDRFEELLGEISAEPEKARERFKLGDRPKAVVAITTPLTEGMSLTDRKHTEEKNALAVEKAAAETARLMAEYDTRAVQVTACVEAITKMGRKEGCLCGTCFNTEATAGVIAPEFAPLIDIARELAEAS